MIFELRNVFDQDFMDKLEANYQKFIQATTYEELLKAMDYKTIQAPRGSSEEAKRLKEQMTSALKEMKESYLIYV